MSINGFFNKFLHYMKLCDDDFEENKVYNLTIDFDNPTSLPDGGFIIYIVSDDRVFSHPSVGFIAISKDYEPSVIMSSKWVLDDDLKLNLVKVLTKFCNALKA